MKNIKEKLYKIIGITLLPFSAILWVIAFIGSVGWCAILFILGLLATLTERIFKR
jgi:hypothetical protein